MVMRVCEEDVGEREGGRERERERERRGGGVTKMGPRRGWGGGKKKTENFAGEKRKGA